MIDKKWNSRHIYFKSLIKIHIYLFQFASLNYFFILHDMVFSKQDLKLYLKNPANGFGPFSNCSFIFYTKKLIKIIESPKLENCLFS